MCTWSQEACKLRQMSSCVITFQVYLLPYLHLLSALGILSQQYERP